MNIEDVKLALQNAIDSPNVASLCFHIECAANQLDKMQSKCKHKKLQTIDETGETRRVQCESCGRIFRIYP